MDAHRYDSVVAQLDARFPACGTTKVVAVDGPSGAGKTAFAGGLAAATGADVLHLEDLYPGWHGLARTPPVVADVLASVAVGGTGSARRWDWQRGVPGAELRVYPDAGHVPMEEVPGPTAADARRFLLGGPAAR